MTYRFSAKNMATKISRIRQIVSFRQVSNVRPEKMYEYFIIASTLPELCVLISIRNRWQERDYLSLGQLFAADLLHKSRRILDVTQGSWHIWNDVQRLNVFCL